MKPRMKMMKQGDKIVGVPEQLSDKQKVILACAKIIGKSNKETPGKKMIVPHYKGITVKVIDKTPVGAGQGIKYAAKVFYPFYAYIVEVEIEGTISITPTTQGYSGNKTWKTKGRVSFVDCKDDHGLQDVKIKDSQLEL